MEIKRLKELRVNSYSFEIEWDKDTYNASFNYIDPKIIIGVKSRNNEEIFMLLCHELQEICAVEMGIRFDRQDCDSEYVFVYDHRQHTTLSNMFAGLISQFIK